MYSFDVWYTIKVLEEQIEYLEGKVYGLEEKIKSIQEGTKNYEDALTEELTRGALLSNEFVDHLLVMRAEEMSRIVEKKDHYFEIIVRVLR